VAALAVTVMVGAVLYSAASLSFAVNVLGAVYESLLVPLRAKLIWVDEPTG